MPKKIVSLLAVVFMLITASAYAETYCTLPQVIEQAEAGWRQTYQAYGRTIAVDIVPLLPEAERFPVLYCSWKTDWNLVPQDGQEHPLEIDGQSYMATDRTDDFLLDTNGKSDEEWFISHEGKKINAKPYRQFYPPYAPNTAYIPSNPITLEEITAKIKSIMQGMGLDVQMLAKEPCEFGTHSFYIDNTDREKSLVPGVGLLTWQQTFEGIPIISDLQSNRAEVGIHCLYRNEEFHNAHFCLWNVDYEMAPDVPLCGFDKVVKILEQEIEAGRLRRVFEIQLGYGQFHEDGVPDSYRKVPKLDRHYYLKPVWRVRGIWVRSARNLAEDIVYDDDDPNYRDVRNSVHQAFITFDAQTGELLINSNEGGPIPIERTYYHGYLSWENAGGRPGK